MNISNIEENHKKNIDYLSTQLKRINDQNILSILIETISELDSRLDSDSLSFEEMDLLKMIHNIYEYAFEENYSLTIEELIKHIKRQLIEWIYLANERELENVVGVQL